MVSAWNIGVHGQGHSSELKVTGGNHFRLCMHVTRRDKGTVGCKADLNWKL